MNKILKILLFGFLTWLIPFVISFLFYTKEGQPKIDIFLFKTIMIIVGAISAVVLLVYHFKDIDIDYVKEGIIVGLSWLAINWVLDLAILIPMSGMSIGSYFAEIGLRYLAIPIYSIGLGYVKR